MKEYRNGIIVVSNQFSFSNNCRDKIRCVLSIFLLGFEIGLVNQLNEMQEYEENWESFFPSFHRIFPFIQLKVSNVWDFNFYGSARVERRGSISFFFCSFHWWKWLERISSSTKKNKKNVSMYLWYLQYNISVFSVGIANRHDSFQRKYQT